MIFPKVQFLQVRAGEVTRMEYLGKLPQGPVTSPRSFPKILPQNLR